MVADITQLVLPRPSDNCRQVIEILSSTDPNFKALDTTLSRNEELSNAIIKFSNSPFHHRESEIDDVNTAINMLGLANVYNAVVTTVLKEYTQDNVTGNRILQHCITISALSSFVASKTSKFLQHELELLGLLHDLPSMVLCHNFKPEYRALVKGQSKTSSPLEQVEQEIFGLDRCVLLGLAMRELGLPDKMSNILTQYHSISAPEHAEKDQYLSILSLAHHMETSVVSEKLRLFDTLPGDRESLQAKLVISDDDYSTLINESRDVINEHVALVA